MSTRSDLRLPAQPLRRRRLDEKFRHSAGDANLELADFWSWHGSDLLGNTLRGALAEFLVAKALGIALHVRDEWGAWDLETADGLRIEVKCSGYLQSWGQKQPTGIQFGIARHLGWSRELGEFVEPSKRWADVYVFSLFAHRDKPSADPMDLDQWRFLALPARTLDEKCGARESIGESALVALAGEWRTFEQLGAAFAAATDGLVRARDGERG